MIAEAVLFDIYMYTINISEKPVSPPPHILELFPEDGDNRFPQTFIPVYQTTWCHVSHKANDMKCGHSVKVTADFNAVVQHHGLLTSVIGLKSVVTPQHFLSGHMQIRCVATISTAPQYGYHDHALPLEDNREVFLLSRHEFIPSLA